MNVEIWREPSSNLVYHTSKIPDIYLFGIVWIRIKQFRGIQYSVPINVDLLSSSVSRVPATPESQSWISARFVIRIFTPRAIS
jgi:hypothetical protein